MRSRKRRNDFGCDACHGLAVRRVHDGNGELIAAKAKAEIVPSQNARNQPGDCRKQLISEVMPERVIDLFEAIKVKQKKCHLSAGFRATDKGIAHLMLKQRAVGEPGERIVVGADSQGLARRPCVRRYPELSRKSR